jgi:hypothetical protein
MAKNSRRNKGVSTEIRFQMLLPLLLLLFFSFDKNQTYELNRYLKSPVKGTIVETLSFLSKVILASRVKAIKY